MEILAVCSHPLLSSLVLTSMCNVPASPLAAVQGWGETVLLGQVTEHIFVWAVFLGHG